MHIAVVFAHSAFVEPYFLFLLHNTVESDPRVSALLG